MNCLKSSKINYCGGSGFLINKKLIELITQAQKEEPKETKPFCNGQDKMFCQIDSAICLKPFFEP